MYPRWGLCNRLRAIASAKRLCARVGARCTIIWDWGDYRALFDDDTDWTPHADPTAAGPDRVAPGYHHIRHLAQSEGGNTFNRRVPVTTHRHIVVNTAYVFGAAEEPPLAGEERAVLAWFPRPSAAVLDRVTAFHRAHFPSRIIGLHVRRTDNRGALLRSPDDAYFREADRAVDRGYHLFLGTDNEATVGVMHARYGTRLILYPKTSPMEQRWPRRESIPADLVDDVVDLWLLASCEFVIGSAASSYSRVAILLNGSARCRAFDQLSPSWRVKFHALRSGRVPPLSVVAAGILRRLRRAPARRDEPGNQPMRGSSVDERLQAALARVGPGADHAQGPG